ncbi:hypothetical protein TNCV_1292201 [Trichonephila clavipes]|nr:hypothetical protein TNCV_1292201 [Trichonephila clavipes]
MIESTTNSNEFRSKDRTVVRIPDADFNIVPRSVTKNTTPCYTRIRTTTIYVGNQGLIVRGHQSGGPRENFAGPQKNVEYTYSSRYVLTCSKYRVFFFSDEAHFWLNGYVNKRNCRIWSEVNPQVYVETPLHPE